VTRGVELDRELLNRGFPGSNWGNLGLWSDAQTYPAACEALATRLAERAQLLPGCSVLDVGFGHGDQLLLWKRRFQAGRIAGIEVDEAGVAEARRKMAAFDDVKLGIGDGAWTERFDRVLALDCAYHFDPRSRVFERALQALNPGGVLALTDLVLQNDREGWIRSRLARACAIPAENLLTPQAYVRELEELGFTDVSVEFLDDAVLGGFSRFALRHLRQAGLRACSAGGLKILATAAIGAWLRRRNRVHYVLVTARRSSAIMVSR